MPIIVGPYTPPVVPTTATSSDGFVTATVDLVHGGVLLVADYSAAVPQPYQVTFRRDGQLVRSGDPAWAPGGLAIAYDYEMALGVPSIWTATPIYRTAGAGFSTGVESAGAAVTGPNVDTVTDFWIKSVPNPNLSMRVRSQIPDPTIGQTGRNSLTDIPGSPVYAGSWDVALTSARQVKFLTATHLERDDFIKLLDSGPVLVQSLALYGIYDFYAKSADVSQEYHVGAYDPRREIQVTFLPIARPATVGAPLYLPGHSYDDVDAAYVSYDQLDSAVASYRSLAGA